MGANTLHIIKLMLVRKYPSAPTKNQVRNVFNCITDILVAVAISYMKNDTQIEKLYPALLSFEPQPKHLFTGGFIVENEGLLHFRQFISLQ